MQPHAPSARTRRRVPYATVCSALLLLVATACGGGGGGAGPFGAGQGLVLMNFEQDAFANAQLNTALLFEFSEPVDPNTVSASAIQIREGPSFGATVPGEFRVNGATVVFEPQLPGNCDLSDSGLKPDTTYRVSVVGFPEEFALRNTVGQPLSTTDTFTFTTLADQGTALFADAVPAAQPVVLASAPADGAQAVKVENGNRVVLTLSENVDPCSVNQDSVRFHIYQLGDKDTRVAADGGAGNASGFATAGGATADQAPGDPYSWGSAAQLPDVITLPTPQLVPAQIELVQGFGGTQVVITPSFGYSPDPLQNRSKFPENALLVVELTFDISDFGGSPLVPFTMAFTTENLTAQSSSYEMENEGETPFLLGVTTADVNTARSPSRVQGFMLFAGDGDNGDDQLSPSLPGSPASACALVLQPNDGAKDDFDPTEDVLLDTGGSLNTCTNDTDGSEAVIWEFRSFRIRDGVTVRVVGVNPAIILVQGDVTIDTGGRLLVRADGQGGAPVGRGGVGYNNARANTVTPPSGGVGVAGGGDGGDATKPGGTSPYGEDGRSAYGSSDGPGVEGGEGAGLGGVSTRHPSTSNPWPSGSSQGGGGGGHATVGETSSATIANGVTLLGAARGTGGGVYPTGSDAARMRTPQGGGGGGAAGYGDENTSSTTFTNGGGSGGAGGGFLDLTSSGNIQIAGTIDAAGSPGGGGGNDTFYGAGGGGGGAGGGVRLLTPGDIVLSGATLTTAGGAGGNATIGTGGGLTGPFNHGGAGGVGRIVLEDADSVIAGQGSAQITPSEGTAGFFRGIFDATRFQGGGLEPFALTGVFPVGPLNPTFVEPVQGDFVAGVPTAGAPGANNTALLIEVRGYQMLPDGSHDPASETDWFSVGHFLDTGVETQPAWVLGHPSDVAIPADNALDAASPKGHSGAGFGSLNAVSPGNGFEFLQVRVTVYLPGTIGPFDPGSYLDHWSIRFAHDQ